MNISISNRNELLTESLRRHTERRLLFALSRFDSRIRHVDVVLSDENGPRGGIDKVCRITVSLNQATDVVIRNKDAEMTRCISKASERAGRSVARSIEKTKLFDRSRATGLEHSLTT